MDDGDTQRLEQERLRQEARFKKWMGLKEPEQIPAGPSIVHRAKALQWLVVTEHYIRTFTLAEGWEFFCQPKDMLVFHHPTTTSFRYNRIEANISYF